MLADDFHFFFWPYEGIKMVGENADGFQPHFRVDTQFMDYFGLSLVNITSFIIPDGSTCPVG